MAPQNFDMNLLVVLGVLMEERSVTRTGIRLGRTQSAISNSLKKLREALDDPLMVRGPDGLVPTPRAIALQDQVQTILGMTQECLSPHQIFDPSMATGGFRISAPDRLSLPVMLPLLKSLQRAAPGISVDLVNADREQALNGLDDDELDIAIGWFDQAPARFNTSHLFTDSLSCVCREDHPIIKQKTPITLETLRSYSHLIVSTLSSRTAAFDEILALRESKRRVAISVSNFSTVPAMLKDSDLIGVYSERIANVLAEDTDLCAMRLPDDIEKFDHYLVWHIRYDNDPRHRWLRDQIIAAEGQQPTSQ